MGEQFHTIPIGEERYAVIAVDPEARTARWVKPEQGKPLYKSRQSAAWHREREDERAMVTSVKQLTDGMIFYAFPWGDPTKAVVEYESQMYEVRESWGTREGWTHNYGARPMTDDEVTQYAEDLTEMSTAEIKQSFDFETLQGIVEAVKEKTMIYSNERPTFMDDATANWLESLRDVNGVPASTLESIIERAESDYNAYAGGEATDEERAQARYDYMRFAGVSAEFADQYRDGIQ